MKEEKHELKTDKGNLILIMRQEHWGGRKVWSLVVDGKEKFVCLIILKRRMIFGTMIKRASQFKDSTTYCGIDPSNFKRDYNKASSQEMKQIVLNPALEVNVKSVD